MAQDAAPATLVLWTESYPYAGALEHTFLKSEIPALICNFDRVILVPGARKGTREVIPRVVEVDESYAEGLSAMRRRHLLSKALRQPALLADLALRPPARHVISAKRLAVFAGQAEYARDWAIEFCGRQRINPRRCVFYTYWWSAATTGFGLAKKSLRGARVVTRAHGADLYESRHVPAYIPCRSQSISVLDALYPDSDVGREYVSRTYRLAPPILETARLGVSAPRKTCQPSTDNVLRVVSCSLMVPVKRIDRLVNGLAVAGRTRPDQRIEWTHFGTGALYAHILRQTAALPPNVRGRLAGYSTQEELLATYGELPFDVFVNVSASEGTPVAVMEAISCGIPVVATAVGGNREIVSAANGILLDANASPDQIGRALLDMIDLRPQLAGWRGGSRRVWADRYNAERNFGEFASKLRNLVEMPPREKSPERSPFSNAQNLGVQFPA